MRGSKLYKSLDSYLGQAGILLLAALPGARSGRVPAEREFRKVLVVKLAALGDTVLLTAAFQELRRRYPRAEIGMIGTALNRDLVAELPHLVDRFHCLDAGRAVRQPAYWLQFVREVRAGRWEVGIDFDQWAHLTPILLRQAGIPTRVGFRTASRVRHLLYTHTEPRDGGSHEAENFLRLLRPLGIQPSRPLLDLPVDLALAARFREHSRAHGWDGRAPIVLVHPGCGAHGGPRAWPLDSYRELGARLTKQARPFFLFTGAGAESELAHRLASAAPGHSWVPGPMALREFIACLSIADLVISGNTGAMHLAAGLHLPQIALHGPTDARKWGPLNPHATVLRTSCPECPCLDLGWEYHRTDGECMALIPVDEVFAAASALLAAPRATRWFSDARTAEAGARP